MKKKLITLIIGCLVSSNSYSLEIIHSPSTIIKLGQGYEPNNQLFKSACITGSKEQLGYSEGNLSVKAELNETELSDSLGMSVGGKYRTGATKSSASAKFLRSSASSSKSLSFIFEADYKFAPTSFQEKDKGWTELAKDYLYALDENWEPIIPNESNKEEWKGAVVARNDEKFLKKCGTHFVLGQTSGAKLLYSFRIDFVSNADKNSFGTDFSFSSPSVDIKSNFEKKMSKVSKRTRVSITVLQIGGAIEKLGSILGTETATGETNAYSFVQCTNGGTGELNKCLDVLASAMRYVTSKEGFSKNFTYDTHGNLQGAAVLSSILGSYTDVGNLETIQSPETSQLIRETRKSLSDIFETYLQAWIDLKRIKSTGIPRLNQQQSDNRLKWEVMAYRDMKELTSRYIDVCYNDQIKCEKVVTDEVLYYYKNRAEAISEGSDFKAQRFAALCDLWQANEMKDERNATMKALYDVANQPIKTETGMTFPLDTKDDKCQAIETYLLGTEGLDLSGKQITELSPLSLLPHIKTLDLSNNLLDDSQLEKLASLPELEDLRLSRNIIRDIRNFPFMPKLLRLHLSNNNLNPVMGLEDKIPSIEYLNLSNAGRRVSCPFEGAKASVCISRDYSRYTSFSESIRSAHNRTGASLVDLNEDFLLIIGGVGENHLEVINKNNMDVRKLKQKTKHAHNMSFIRLEKNRVFAFGTSEDSALMNSYILDFDDDGDLLNRKHIDFPYPPTSSHSIIGLGNGKVLINGGYKDRGLAQVSAAAYIFDKDQESIKEISAMNLARADHSLSLLDDGSVLVIGGYTKNSNGFYVPTNTIERFNPKTQSFEWFNERLYKARFGHSAVQLADGSILVTGGITEKSKTIPDSQSSAVEDPQLPNSTPINDSSGSSRYSEMTKASRTAEIITPSGGVFELREVMTEGRAYHKSIRLESGKIVIFGGLKGHVNLVEGEKKCISCLSSSEIFSSEIDREEFISTGNSMSAGRTLFDIIGLSNNRVLIMGGTGRAGRSIEIFSYTGL